MVLSLSRVVWERIQVHGLPWNRLFGDGFLAGARHRAWPGADIGVAPASRPAAFASSRATAQGYRAALAHRQNAQPEQQEPW
jgi:hypothetical protein